MKRVATITANLIVLGFLVQVAVLTRDLLLEQWRV